MAHPNGHVSLVRAFVSSGCSLSSPGHHGNTVLHSAAQAAQMGVVRFCLASGVDPDCQNTRQETPLHLVAQFYARGLKDCFQIKSFKLLFTRCKPEGCRGAAASWSKSERQDMVWRYRCTLCCQTWYCLSSQVRSDCLFR